MEPSELLQLAVTVLEELGLRYLVTGSTASIFFGEPRFTHDIDIVVDLERGSIVELCSKFPEEEFYVSEESALRAVRRRSQFNIIHPASGLKIDVIVPQDSPFNRSRFSRAKRVKPGPAFEATFAAAEDVIIKKMEAFSEGGSDKHLRDIAGILKISGDGLDYAYIEKWTARLGLETIWETVTAGLAATEE